MKRRSKVSGERINKRRRKTPEPKRCSAPKALAASSDAEEKEIARLIRELSDERRQRTATSEVLHLLSGSPGDLNRLFDTILANATKLCQAHFGTLLLGPSIIRSRAVRNSALGAALTLCTRLLTPGFGTTLT
jgi:hypothetical protein